MNVLKGNKIVAAAQSLLFSSPSPVPALPCSPFSSSPALLQRLDCRDGPVSSPTSLYPFARPPACARLRPPCGCGCAAPVAPFVAAAVIISGGCPRDGRLVPPHPRARAAGAPVHPSPGPGGAAHVWGCLCCGVAVPRMPRSPGSRRLLQSSRSLRRARPPARLQPPCPPCWRLPPQSECLALPCLPAAGSGLLLDLGWRTERSCARRAYGTVAAAASAESSATAESCVAAAAAAAASAVVECVSRPRAARPPAGCACWSRIWAFEVVVAVVVAGRRAPPPASDAGSNEELAPAAGGAAADSSAAAG